MDPRDYFVLAQSLILMKGAGAAHYRSAIGRAYYAAYNSAAGLLEGLKCPLVKTASGHTHAVMLLQSSGDDDLKGISGLLGDLRADRNKADYDMAHKGVEKADVARTKVETASDILRVIDEFLGDEKRKMRAIPKIVDQYKLLHGRS